MLAKNSGTTLLQTSLQFSGDSIRRELAVIEKELASLPEGYLSLNRKYGKTYFVETSDGGRRGITRDQDKVFLLARKKYLLLRKALLLSDLSSIQSIGASADNARPSIIKILNEFAKADLDVYHITLTPEQRSWMLAPYQTNTYRPEDLKFSTSTGKKVRSKSERTIADQLALYGLAFRYEQAFEFDVSSLEGISGTRRGKYRTYYPDFTIMKPSGELILWEHFGLLDLPDYRSASFEKLFVYRQLGNIPDRNMIFTVEADLTDISKVNEIIERRIILNL